MIAFRGSAYPDVGLFCGVICVAAVWKVVGFVCDVRPPVSVPSRYHWICVPVGKVLAGTFRLWVFPETLIVR